ncbi:MAG: hypothetical protein K0Q97_2587 [Bacillota bacterium]|nr:hypothetical protein [Bacillota bacterium]
MNECRQKSECIFDEGIPKNRVAAGIIICIWIIFYLIKYLEPVIKRSLLKR